MLMQNLGGQTKSFMAFSELAPVVQTVDNAIHRINHYPLDIAIGFAITYPVDSDLSGWIALSIV